MNHRLHVSRTKLHKRQSEIILQTVVCFLNLLWHVLSFHVFSLKKTQPVINQRHEIMGVSVGESLTQIKRENTHTRQINVALEHTLHSLSAFRVCLS